MAAWVPPGRPFAEAQRQPADIVAFDLGDCRGQRVYRRMSWYFPSHGENYDPQTATDVCAGF